MPTDETSLPERVAAYYFQLSTVAADLNAVSDALGKSITDIDHALKRLNLGISVWVEIVCGDVVGPYHSNYWSRDIGYAKVDGEWGISLRKVEGDYGAPDDREKIEQWPFNEAPRSLRLEAIERIPELLEKLAAEAIKTTEDIQGKLADAQAVARAVKGAAHGTSAKGSSIASSGTTPAPLAQLGRK